MEGDKPPPELPSSSIAELENELLYGHDGFERLGSPATTVRRTLKFFLVGFDRPYKRLFSIIIIG